MEKQFREVPTEKLDVPQKAPWDKSNVSPVAIFK
jgi:hypothetical protein